MEFLDFTCLNGVPPTRTLEPSVSAIVCLIHDRHALACTRVSGRVLQIVVVPKREKNAFLQVSVCQFV